MRRCLAVMLSVLLLTTSAPLVIADGIYNDDHFNWGEYACPHGTTEAVEAVASTCTEPGHAAYVRCADCKLVVSGSRDPLPLLDHVYDDDWDTDCNACGQIRFVAAPGDADNNGRVNNRDLGLLQRYLNGFSVTVNVLAADLNKDGQVNNRDLAVLQGVLNE